MKKIIFIVFCTAIIGACTKNSPQQKENEFAFTVEKEVETENNVLAPSEFILSLEDNNNQIFIELLYRIPETDSIIDLAVDFEETLIDEFVEKPVILPVTGKDSLNIKVKYKNTLYSAELPYYPDTPPKPYASIGDVKNPFVKKELEMIKEVQAFLEKNSERILQGWTEWEKDEIIIYCPDRTCIALTQKEKFPHRFRPVNGLTIYGKRIFIDETERMEIEADEKNIMWHGEASGHGIKMNVFSSSSITDNARSNPDSGIDLDGNNYEYRFFTYIHEAFHCEQKRRNIKAVKSGTAYPKIRQMDSSRFSVETAVFTELEGRYLAAAYMEEDTKAAFEFFKNACVARHLRFKSFGLQEKNFELLRTTNEGTAVYSEIRAAQLKNTKPAKIFLENKLDEIKSIYSDAPKYFIRSHYIYGLYWALLFDRFMPNWKENFFEQMLNIDTLLEKKLSPSSADFKQIEQAIQTSGEYAEAVKKYTAYFARRDEVVNSFGKQGGIHYSVIIPKTGITNFNIDPYEFIKYGRQMYFPTGVKEFVMGTFIIKSNNTDFRYDMDTNILEWYNSTKNAPYTINGNKEGGIYYNLSVEAEGLSFEIKKAEIKNSSDEVIITMLE